jgi:hypothetical protein
LMRGSTGVPLRLTGRTRGLVPICRRQGGQLNGDMRFDWRAEGWRAKSPYREIAS